MVCCRHFAWFRRDTGQWLGEWAGRVPAPVIDPRLIGDDRLAQLNAWQQRVQRYIVPFAAMWDTSAEEWDVPAWEACPAGGAVCLDVGQFEWPVGDHRWHVWDDAARRLDWPTSHQFIEVRMDTLDVIANVESHRPVRDAVPGRRVFDITGSPLAAYHGFIFGRFVWLGDRWGFAPAAMPARPVPAALAEAPVNFDLAAAFTAEREYVRR